MNGNALIGSTKHSSKKSLFVSRQRMHLTRKISADFLEDIKCIIPENIDAVDFAEHQVVITSHCLPTLVELCTALLAITKNVVFFPIPYSLEEDSLHRLIELGVEVVVEADLESHLKSIADFLESSKKHSYFIECGGYLPLVWDGLSLEAKNRIKGAVEDTERGARNYERISGLLPIIDVARSTCKRFEDAIVGDSVVHSVAHCLRQADMPLVGMKATVIGFGKIGQSCARSLDGFRAKVQVFDRDPHKMLEALNLGYHIGAKKDSFVGTHLIVGTTGENSLRYDDLRWVEDQTVLASASSRQIEFYDLLKNADHSEKVGANLFRYHFGSQNKRLIVVNNGFPANFLHGSSMGSRIDLVLASLVVGYLYLVFNKVQKQSGISALPAETQRMLAEKWLETWNYGKHYSMIRG